MKNIVVAAACAGLLATPVVAQKQGKVDTPASSEGKRALPVSPTEIAAATRYALPHLLGGVKGVCQSRLAPDGYLAREGEVLEARWADGAEAYWPEAKAALLKFGAEQGGGSFGGMTDLPDELLRPVVDGIVFAMVSSELKPSLCPEVERGLELFAPLPPENMAKIVGWLVGMVEADRQAKAQEAGAPGE